MVKLLYFSSYLTYIQHIELQQYIIHSPKNIGILSQKCKLLTRLLDFLNDILNIYEKVQSPFTVYLLFIYDLYNVRHIYNTKTLVYRKQRRYIR